MELFSKFIIEGDNLILMKATYHKEIATDVENVKGGGVFFFKDNTFTLSGSSHDFGPVTLKDLCKCVQSGNVYSDPACYYSMADRHEFYYNTGAELINLRTHHD